MENTKENLEWAKEFIKYAYEHDDDYVCWNFIGYLKSFVEANEEQES